MTDFFISYTQADQAWAEWIAWTLEHVGHKARIQTWDFRPGNNFVIEMQRASAESERTIAVLSEDYLQSAFGMAEWAAAFVQDPTGRKGKLLPVRVRQIDLPGLLSAIVCIDLAGLSEAAAREKLVSGLVLGRVIPRRQPPFPGASRPRFPGEPIADLTSAENPISLLPLDDIPEPTPLPAGSRMPFSRNPLFVGRYDDLQTLARLLKAGETAAVGQVETAATTGLGGIGKTQLACEFVHRYGQFFLGGVFWMTFADPAAVPTEIAACGRSLGLHPRYESLALEQQVHLVEDAWQGETPRLLVFDNCEEESLLARWRPRFGGARVLITSRRIHWDLALSVHNVPLTTLPRVMSVELLRLFRPDLPEEDSTLNKIAAELGDLPLALHLAGSFLERYASSQLGQPPAYLESLHQNDLLAHPSLRGRGSQISPTGHIAHVARTFALSFERLNLADRTDAQAAALLSRAAYFAPGVQVPLYLLFRTIKWKSQTGELQVNDAIDRLTSLGLLNKTSTKFVITHRLIAEFARDADKAGARKRWLRPFNKWNFLARYFNRASARTEVERVLLAEARRLNKEKIPSFLTPLRPHLKAVTDKALEQDDANAVLLCSVLCSHLWKSGEYIEAAYYVNKSLTLFERFAGAEHSDTAECHYQLGIVLKAQGDYTNAKIHLEQAVAIWATVRGPESSSTALGLNGLGLLFFLQDELSIARDYLERVLKIWRKAFGERDLFTAMALGNLGLVLAEQSHYLIAIDLVRQALSIEEALLAPEDSILLTSIANLGYLLEESGEIDEARPLLLKALSLRLEFFGEHPGTGDSLNNFALLLLKEGSIEEARSCLERALAIYERFMGLEYPQSAESLGYLGWIAWSEGDLAKSRVLCQRALKICDVRQLSPTHRFSKKAREVLSLIDNS